MAASDSLVPWPKDVPSSSDEGRQLKTGLVGPRVFRWGRRSLL